MPLLSSPASFLVHHPDSPLCALVDSAVYLWSRPNSFWGFVYAYAPFRWKLALSYTYTNSGTLCFFLLNLINL